VRAVYRNLFSTPEVVEGSLPAAATMKKAA
jgi:hypothetical protein